MFLSAFSFTLPFIKKPVDKTISRVLMKGRRLCSPPNYTLYNEGGTGLYS